DTQSGVGTRVTPFLSIGIAFGLTYGPGGLLYVWGRDQGLEVVDPATGMAVAVGAAPSPAQPGMLSLAADASGSIFGSAPGPNGSGGARVLYRIDPATGVATLLGDLGDPNAIGFGLTGLASLPEPGALGLCALAVMAQLARLRSRRD